MLPFTFYEKKEENLVTGFDDKSTLITRGERVSGYQSIAYNSFILMVSFLGLAANASDPQKTYHEEKGCRLTGSAPSRSQN